MEQAEMVRMNAENVLSGFIRKHNIDIEDFSHLSLEQTGLNRNLNHFPLKLTHFDDLYDTLLYSELITNALQMYPGLKQIIDFGAGSSIPTLLALKASSHKAQVLAVDIDPAALEVSQLNADKLGLKAQYSFHLGSMESFLSENEIKSGTLIVSNPPYIATPGDTSDYHLLPINGGEDGCRYLLDFLERDYPQDTALALFWGSLCNPLKVISAMEERFDVLYARAVKIHFGNYTSLPHMRDHLYKLREQGIVSFEDTAKGEVQLVIGTILRPK